MSYEARPKELLEALQEKGYPEDREAKIRRGLEAYFRHRETLLRSLLDLLKQSKKPNFKTWLDRAMDASRKTHDRFEKIEPDNEWLAAVGSQEHKFFFTLYRCPAVKHRDRLVEQSLELDKAMKEFENKWRKIEDSDKSIEDKMKRAAEEYEKLLVEAAQAAAKAEKESKEKVAALVALVVKVGLKAAGDKLGVVEKILETAVSAVSSTFKKAEQRKLEIFALLSREEQVFASFKESREVVAEFLESYGYPKIKAALADGEEAAEKLEKAMGTDGQKSDAAAFGKAMKGELERIFSAAERAYREFAKKHENLFFGPLASGFTQELMENDFWKSRSSKWKDARRDFDDLLRERTLETREDRVLQISMEGIDPEDRKKIKRKLEKRCRELLAVWNKWKEWSKKNPEWILDSREDLESVLKALR